MKVTSKLKIKNQYGLHARPAMMIVKLLQPFKSSVTFSYNHMQVNARSIMSILALAAGQDSSISVTIEGIDAEETLKSLKDAFEKGFEEHE